MESSVKIDDFKGLKGLGYHPDEWFEEDARRMMAMSWPQDEPAICDDYEGWTFSKVLRYFDKEDKIVFRLPSSSAWLVFPDRKSFSVMFVLSQNTRLFWSNSEVKNVA